MTSFIDDDSIADEPTPKKGRPAITDDATVASAFAKPTIEDEEHSAEWWQNPSNFLSGARPIQRAHVIYGRGDLYARIDELAELEIRATGDQAAVLKAEAVELTAELLASGMTVVVEARSSDWVEKFRARLDKLKIADGVERFMRQMAAQVVEPAFDSEGDAYEFLAAFAEVSDVQVARLAEKVQAVNEQVPPVNPRFLAASSGAISGVGSLMP